MNKYKDDEDKTKPNLSTVCVSSGAGHAGPDIQTPPLPNGKKPKKKGCGCLLICFGVFLIMFVALVPMFELFTVEAPYAAGPIPVVGHLQTQVELYQYEFNSLPGLWRNADETVGQTSQLAKGLSRVQTFSGTEPAAWTADFSKIEIVTNGNHFARAMDVGFADLTAPKLRPAHFQYRVDGWETNRYAYAVGVFMDGEGLKQGTGYAVMEIVDLVVGKAVGTWKRYKPVAGRKQIVMVNAEEARKYFKCDSPEQAQRMNICWVGDTDALMSGDKARVEKALKELEAAGWEFEK